MLYYRAAKEHTSNSLLVQCILRDRQPMRCVRSSRLNMAARHVTFPSPGPLKPASGSFAVRGVLTRRASPVVPVLRPRLPSAAGILPFLQRIDEVQWYSNYGPLVKRLESDLAGLIDCTMERVVTTANATCGITVALLARGVRAGSACIMPSWTFAATPHAARAAGLTPWFHDVDASSWALDPDRVEETVKNQPDTSIGAVIVVSPFGAPLDMDAWEAFEDRTGICVVVDAAAGFDTVRPSRIPSVVSLHATKIFGAGEGGFITTTDAQLLDRIAACCNFGFEGSRSAILPALNAKMSEYHAAVALAALQLWPGTRAANLRIIEWYRRALSRISGIALQPGYGDGWACGTTSIVLPAGMLPNVARSLSERGIETRAWWGDGCHVQPAFADCRCGPLDVTEQLAGRVLGLPHYTDMPKRDVDFVAEAISTALGRSLRAQRRAS